MRIIHFSDLHIGVENYGRIDPATGLSTRMGDFLAAFDELVDYALDNRVDLVIFAGDAFKSRDPNQTQQREFAKRIARLAGEEIKVFLLVGNHDLPHALARATAIEIYDTLAIRNVTVADKPGTWRIDTRSGPIQIVALPWPRRSLLLSREHTKNLTYDQMNDEIQRILTQRLLREAEGLDPALPAILTAHVTVAQATLGSERSMMVGSDHVLLLGNVALPAFDYVALGHIHKTQVLGQDPPVVYSGSLQRVDFSEEKDEKGFYVIELDPTQEPGRRACPELRRRAIDYRFQPVKARPFVTIDVTIRPEDLDPTATILQHIQRHPLAQAIVRVRIQVPAELEAMVLDSDIRKALAQAHFVASIAKEVDRRRPSRLEGHSVEAMTPMDALKAYIDSVSGDRGWSPQQVKELLTRGEQLIRETTTPSE
ncbi:MAG: exonuclease SbcCD subunit D [Dehalococcoidia bacterium]